MTLKKRIHYDYLEITILIAKLEETALAIIIVFIGSRPEILKFPDFSLTFQKF